MRERGEVAVHFVDHFGDEVPVAGGLVNPVEEGVACGEDVVLGLLALARRGDKRGKGKKGDCLYTFWRKLVVISSLGKLPSGVTRIRPCSSKMAAASVIFCALLAYTLRILLEWMATPAMTKQLDIA